MFFYEYSTLQVNKYLTFALEMPCVFVQSIPGQLGIRWVYTRLSVFVQFTSGYNLALQLNHVLNSFSVCSLVLQSASHWVIFRQQTNIIALSFTDNTPANFQTEFYITHMHKYLLKSGKCSSGRIWSQNFLPGSCQKQPLPVISNQPSLKHIWHCLSTVFMND